MHIEFTGSKRAWEPNLEQLSTVWEDPAVLPLPQQFWESREGEGCHGEATPKHVYYLEAGPQGWLFQIKIIISSVTQSLIEIFHVTCDKRSSKQLKYIYFCKQNQNENKKFKNILIAKEVGEKKPMSAESGSGVRTVEMWEVAWRENKYTVSV